MTDWGKTSVGLSANTAACLCYLLGWLSGIVFLLLEKVLHPVVVHSDAKLRKLAETKGYLKPFR